MAFDEGHTWTAISNPWIDPGSEQAVLRAVPTPSIPLKNPDLYGATIKLAEWLTSPLTIPSPEPSPSVAPFHAEPSSLLPVRLPITLRQFYAAYALQGLYAGPLRNRIPNSETSVWAVEEALRIADALIAHEFKNPSYPEPPNVPNPNP